jgi:hypothetical protein
MSELTLFGMPLPQALQSLEKETEELLRGSRCWYRDDVAWQLYTLLAEELRRLDLVVADMPEAGTPEEANLVKKIKEQAKVNIALIEGFTYCPFHRVLDHKSREGYAC